MHELTVEDGVLFALVAWQLQLAQALEQRGHAATQRIRADAPAHGDAPTQAAAAAVRGAQPARTHPDWETAAGSVAGRIFWRPSPQREALVADLSHALLRAFAPA
jgi:hypothetical protein